MAYAPKSGPYKLHTEPSESDLHVEVAAEVDLGLEGLARPQLGRLDGRERVLQRQELGDLLVHLCWDGKTGLLFSLPMRVV